MTPRRYDPLREGVTMASCTSCGHQLGVGRFCASCGARVDAAAPASRAPLGAEPGPGPGPDPGSDLGQRPTTLGDDWRTDTAERVPRLDPRTPPAAAAPPPPRYPLFADEVDAYPTHGPLTIAGPDTAAAHTQPHLVHAGGPAVDHDQAANPDGHQHGHPHGHQHEHPHGAVDVDRYDEERRSPVLWILVAALVLVLIAAGWWFLVRSDGAEGADNDAGEGSPGSAEEATSATAEGIDVAGRASVQAPETAPPNEDVNGDPVSYDASNMLDGVPATAWRTPGDASGMSLSLTLHEPTELRRVGLVNGYAKTSTSTNGTFDWYLGNRRVKAVVWGFDDGTKVRQQLIETRELQTVDVPDVVTATVVLTIVRVTGPGPGRAGRDYTAIGEVSLLGSPL